MTNLSSDGSESSDEESPITLAKYAVEHGLDSPPEPSDGESPITTIQSTGVTLAPHLDVIWEWENADLADEVEGYDLIRDEAMFELVGVPFAIFKLQYREGIQRKGVPWRDDYVSIQLRVAPAKVLANSLDRITSRRRGDLVKDKQAIAKPGEELIINDGSTGLYRQVTQYLCAKQIIDVGDAFPETGEKGECRYDLPRSEWLVGAEQATEGIPVRLRCSRGLRYSEYTNDYTGDKKAVTWYLA